MRSVHRLVFQAIPVFFLVSVGITPSIAAQLSREQQQSLAGKWQLRIDGGGEIYSARLHLKSDGSKARRLVGEFSADGKKASIRGVERVDHLYLVKFQIRRRGLPAQATLVFELEADRLVGDVDFDSGTSVRSYEFEAMRISGGGLKEKSRRQRSDDLGSTEAAVEKQETLTLAKAKRPDKGQVVIRRLDFQQGQSGYAGTVDTEIWAIAPSKSLFEQGTMTTDGNNGGGESQVLMRFADVFGRGDRQVPHLSRVVSAKLIVVAFDPGSTIYLHRMLAPWDDSATWDGMAGGVGVDNIEASTVRDGFNFGEINMDKQSIEFDVTATVQKWSNGEPNYGWVFTSTGSNGWDFYSSNWIEQDLRPQLEVEFEELTVRPKHAARPSPKESRNP